MQKEELFAGLEKRMKKASQTAEREIRSVRAGRASPAMVENIQVRAYDQKMRLVELATISIPDPRTILIKPFDKSLLSALEKAIQTSDLDLPPNVQGDMIRLNIPPLTQERREEMIKKIHKEAEEGRVAIRNIRRDGKEKIERALKNKEISEDESRRLLEELQKLTDRYVAEVDAILERKEKELKTI